MQKVDDLGSSSYVAQKSPFLDISTLEAENIIGATLGF